MRPLLFIILLSLSSRCFSQDVIIKKDSSKIFCRIVSEEGTTIQFYSAKEKNGPLYYIDRADILKCYSADAISNGKAAKIGTEETIYGSKVLVKGLYRCYVEFLVNSPSAPTNVVARKREAADLMFNHGSDWGYEADGQYVVSAYYYGFCDGRMYMSITIIRRDIAKSSASVHIVFLHMWCMVRERLR